MLVVEDTVLGIGVSNAVYLGDVGTEIETVSGRLLPVKSILSLPCAHFPKMRWSGKKLHMLSASSVLVMTADVPNHDAPE